MEVLLGAFAVFAIAVFGVVGFIAWVGHTPSRSRRPLMSTHAQGAPGSLATRSTARAPEPLKAEPVSPKQSKANRDAKIVCQFCQEAGGVTTRQEKRSKRASATRVGMGALTLGVSAVAVGVTKKGWVTAMRCANCGMAWDVPVQSRPH